MNNIETNTLVIHQDELTDHAKKAIRAYLRDKFYKAAAQRVEHLLGSETYDTHLEYALESAENAVTRFMVALDIQARFRFKDAPHFTFNKTEQTGE